MYTAGIDQRNQETKARAPGTPPEPQPTSRMKSLAAADNLYVSDAANSGAEGTSTPVLGQDVQRTPRGLRFR
jgi:hypothetical protein